MIDRTGKYIDTIIPLADSGRKPLSAWENWNF